MKKIILPIFILLYLFNCQSTAQSYIPVRNDTRFKIKPVAPIKLYGFNLEDVKLLPGNQLMNAMEKDSAYLLSLKPDRLLARFYLNAHLPLKDSVYGGWEKEGLSGHTLGHYLSALSMMYVSTKNAECKKRVDYIVGELVRCQQARGTGYVGAIPKEDSLFYKVSVGDIKSSGFDLNGGWSPWYTVHKVMAGLLDAYLYTHNQQALQVVQGMADWTFNTLKNLNETQLQKMLTCEYGGMNDVLVNLYAVTSNKKYLDLSYKFFDDFVMKPLSQQQDVLPGKHSNTNIPKAIGSAAQYEYTGNTRDSTIAAFFWHTVVNHHTYVIGGNGNYEYFNAENHIGDKLSDDNDETCASYNMLKLTRHLFSWQPSAELGDYYERTLYNHILGSQNPENGMTTYFVPLRMGGKKSFSDSFNTFTCCVGTSMENHSKYTESIYAESADGNSLYVNMFIPSQLNWKYKNVIVTQQTGFPFGDSIYFFIETKQPKTFNLKIRKPYWAINYSILINGKLIKTAIDNDGFISINYHWKNKDRIIFVPTKTLRAEATPDNNNRIAILYGPIVLAGNLGDTMPDRNYGTTVLLTDNKNVNDWIKPINAKEMLFKMAGVGKPNDVALQPFFNTYKNYYSVYWDYFTNAQFAARQAEFEAEKQRQQAIAAKTIDVFRIGEMQPERDHHLAASENSYTSEAFGEHGREARSGGFFAFDMTVNPVLNNHLLITYLGDDKNREFDIEVNGKVLQKETLTGGELGKFFDKEYILPKELIGDKNVIQIKISANYKKTAGRIFGVRIIKE